MKGNLVYFVVPVRDADRAKAFYGGLLGWEFAEGNVPGGLHITNVSPPGGVYAGGDDAGPHSSPQVFFEVDDIDGAVARVRELGGEAGDPERIQSGWMARCRDNQGVEIWLWAAAGKQ
jgi:predicted enzyme related to lactoylglutathione lyase